MGILWELFFHHVLIRGKGTPIHIKTQKEEFWINFFFLLATSFELCSLSSNLVEIERFLKRKHKLSSLLHWRIFSFLHLLHCGGLLFLVTLALGMGSIRHSLPEFITIAASECSILTDSSICLSIADENKLVSSILKWKKEEASRWWRSLCITIQFDDNFLPNSSLCWDPLVYRFCPVSP